MSITHLPPFGKDDELVHANVTTQSQFTVPNHYIPSPAKPDLDAFLAAELDTPVLDDLYKHLWFVAKRDGTNIDALHKQHIKRRTILIAEDPGLHLVWYYDIVYIKPIPHFLMNYAFWQAHLIPQTSGKPTASASYRLDSLSSQCKAALGFLRSYSSLIVHESDFYIAQDERLVPPTVTFSEFQRFIAPFRNLSDEIVAKRFHYGQIRLTRLDWAVRICRPAATGRVFPWYYQNQYWQTGQAFGPLLVPLGFAFAACSLILSALQVVLAALGTQAWVKFTKFSWVFSVVTVSLLAAILAAAVVVFVMILATQAQFAIREKWRRVRLERNLHAHGITQT